MNDHERAPRSAKRDTGESRASEAALDDQALAAMVREAAERWTMPPQRLDRPTWREVAAERGRGRRGAGGLWSRLAAAGATALVATLVLAIAAVWLATPRSNAPLTGASAAPATAASPGSATAGSPSPAAATPATPGPALPTPGPMVPTPLPDVAVYGAPLPQTAILVAADPGFRMLDLTRGVFGQVLARQSAPGTQILRRADGTFVCVCAAMESAVDAGGKVIEGVTVNVRTFAADGIPLSTVAGPSYLAPVDPHASAQGASSWDVSSAISSNGKVVYLGWALLDGDAWRTGIDVIDVATGDHLLPKLLLPTLPATEGPLSVYSWAPRLRIAPDGRHAMVLLSQATVFGGQLRTTRQLADVASNGSLQLGDTLAALPGDDQDPSNCAAPEEGFAGPSTYFALCNNFNATLYRMSLDGSLLSTTDLGNFPKAYPAQPVIDQAKGRLYGWNPFTRTLGAVDLSTGRLVGLVSAPAPQARSGGIVADVAGAPR